MVLLYNTFLLLNPTHANISIIGSISIIYHVFNDAGTRQDKAL